MMTKAEGNDFQNLVFTIAKAYVESDLTWAEVKSIVYEMLQGKTFDTIITQKNLTQRLSPALLKLIAISNKQEIILSSISG